jgi:hypothetical protein
MQLINRTMVAVGMICALALGSSLHAAPPAKATGSPLQPAIVALLKEYHEAAKKNFEGLRDKSDYFAKDKPADVTPEVVLAALEKPIGTDRRAEAYVKWQLLSGVEAKFPDQLKARALRVYRNAPSPGTHPGADHTYLERKLHRIGITNGDQEEPINKDVTAAITQYRLSIEPILSYRDELYSRMPSGFDTYPVALGDLYTRVTNGAPATKFWEDLMGSMRAWALGSTDSAKMHELAGAVEKIYTFVKDDRNKPFYRVMWVKEDKYPGLRWVSQGTIDQDKKMDEFAQWLNEHANNPSGGLNFKEPAGKK